MASDRVGIRKSGEEASANASPATGFDLDWIGSRTGSGERRQVVMLAVAFPPAGAADPEVIAETLERRRHFVWEIAVRYGGLIERVDTELQLLCWGWPIAHEADVRLAVAAALTIVADPVHLAHCGIDAGIAVTQQMALPATAGGTGPVGEMMRTAVAMMAEAGPGDAVVSPSVRELVGNEFELKPVGRGGPRGSSCKAFVSPQRCRLRAD